MFIPRCYRIFSLGSSKWQLEIHTAFIISAPMYHRSAEYLLISSNLFDILMLYTLNYIGYTIVQNLSVYNAIFHIQTYRHILSKEPLDHCQAYLCVFWCIFPWFYIIVWILKCYNADTFENFVKNLAIPATKSTVLQILMKSTVLQCITSTLYWWQSSPTLQGKLGNTTSSLMWWNFVILSGKNK